MIANTIEAAPLKPAKETSSICSFLHLKGAKIANTAAGLAIKVKNRAINNAVKKISGNLDGVAKSPSRKKISICIRPVIPSKKLTIDFFPLILVFPRMIPTM